MTETETAKRVTERETEKGVTEIGKSGGKSVWAQDGGKECGEVWEIECGEGGQDAVLDEYKKVE